MLHALALVLGIALVWAVTFLPIILFVFWLDDRNEAR